MELWRRQDRGHLSLLSPSFLLLLSQQGCSGLRTLLLFREPHVALPPYESILASGRPGLFAQADSFCPGPRRLLGKLSKSEPQQTAPMVVVAGISIVYKGKEIPLSCPGLLVQ